MGEGLDPDFAHSVRVAGLSLQLYDGLVKTGMLRMESEMLSSNNGATSDARNCLYIAALLHDVGKSAGGKEHPKKSQSLIRRHGAPLGWKPENMARAAIIARFHAGALPTRRHKALRDLLPGEQKIVIRLAAILRLANAFDSGHDGRIRRVWIETARPQTHPAAPTDSCTSPHHWPRTKLSWLRLQGYADGTPAAQTIAAERYLLETVLRRPVIVKPDSAARLPATGVHQSTPGR